MIKYFVIFTAIGFAIGRFVPSAKVSFSYIAVVSLFWGSQSEVIWGLVALGELSLGYLIATIFLNPRAAEANAAKVRPDLGMRK